MGHHNMANKKVKSSSFIKRTFTITGLQLLVAIVVFGAVGSYGVWKSFADKAYPATLTASPNPISVSDVYTLGATFTGCGYLPNVGTTIFVQPIGGQGGSFFGGTADASGCINITHTGFTAVAGTYGVQASQETKVFHGKVQSKVMGYTTLTVTQ
jgi:hypothetical protein